MFWLVSALVIAILALFDFLWAEAAVLSPLQDDELQQQLEDLFISTTTTTDQHQQHIKKTPVSVTVAFM